MNVASLGNTIYAAVKCDASACVAIRKEFAALALSIATDPNASARVTSATVNGQTFSSQPTMTQGQRLQVLRWVVACLDGNTPVSARQLTEF